MYAILEDSIIILVHWASRPSAPISSISFLQKHVKYVY